MDDEELLDRRQFFTSWTQGLAEGLARWVVPHLERQRDAHLDLARQLGDLLGVDDPPPAAVQEEPHPWRDLLTPPDER
jgi:hypothetical protein